MWIYIFLCVLLGFFAEMYFRRSGVLWFFIGLFITPLIAALILIVVANADRPRY